MTLPASQLSLIDLVVTRARQRVARNAENAKAALEPPPPIDLGNIQLKMCYGCKKPLPATREYFYAHRTTADKLDGRCKTCKRKYDRERRQKSRLAARDR
jgi:hypothetical protein